jgi:GT2 family glycosyltransferase
MRTGFVVLTYNRPQALLAVLRALAPQCGPGDAVVIADDGSRPENVDAMRAGLPSFACDVRHVWHEDVGFTAARARNLGALHAGCEYIVFLDGDCIPTAHFAAQHRALAQPGCFLNGSRVLLDERLTRSVEAGAVDVLALEKTDWLRLRLQGSVNKLTHLVQWPGAPGRRQARFSWKGIRSANFGVWMRDLQAVNGFDESFRGWGHEDADLVLRLHHAGLVRKNGFLATEVFHLWHRENSRERESHNRRRVEERMATRITRAEAGLEEAAASRGAVVTELNRRWRHQSP